MNQGAKEANEAMYRRGIERNMKQIIKRLDLMNEQIEKLNAAMRSFLAAVEDADTSGGAFWRGRETRTDD